MEHERKKYWDSEGILKINPLDVYVIATILFDTMPLSRSLCLGYFKGFSHYFQLFFINEKF